MRYKVEAFPIEDHLLMECSACGPICVCCDMQGARIVAVKHLTEHGAEAQEEQ